MNSRYRGLSNILLFSSQSATAFPFRALIPEIPHLHKFCFKPVKDEDVSVIFSNSLTEVKFFMKNVH